MKLLTADMKMAEVIHHNYLLIPVIRRFGIRLGFGEKTVSAICNELGIDTEFFLTITNTYSNDNYFPEKKLQQLNIIEFINYLRKTHVYYLNNMVPAIENLINKLMKSSSVPASQNNLLLVKDFFLKYKEELIEHLNREENKTFPYIEKLYDIYYKNADVTKFKKLYAEYSIEQFADEHNNVDEELYDLQSILIKYLNGDYDESLIQSIIFEIFRLEKDIKNHTRLEEMILKPMVTELENAIKKQLEKEEC